MERVADGAVRVLGPAEEGAWTLAVKVLDRAFAPGLARGQGEPPAARTSPGASLAQLIGLSAASHDTRHDLCLRLADPTDLAPRDWLARDWPLAPVELLDAPSGLVIRALDGAEARATLLFLQDRGFEVTLTSGWGCLHDVFAEAPGFRPSAALEQYLRILGPGEVEPLSHVDGALAAGLEARTAELLVARFAGLISVPRAFQRFDLYVTGPGLLSPREAADFLASRGRAHPGRLAPGQVMRAESRLNRAAARQFLQDYRQIGLPTELRLCGLGQKG